MCMEKLEVVTVSLPALLGRNDMIGLQNIAMFEIQSTPGTNTALLLQELGFPGIEHGVFTHAGGPVQEVAIKWAAGRLDFRVPDNMVIGILVKPMPFWVWKRHCRQYLRIILRSPVLGCFLQAQRTRFNRSR